MNTIAKRLSILLFCAFIHLHLIHADINEDFGIFSQCDYSPREEWNDSSDVVPESTSDFIADPKAVSPLPETSPSPPTAAVRPFSITIPSFHCDLNFCTQASLEHIEAQGIGYDTGYTTLGAVAFPASCSTIQPFIDLRSHLFNDGKTAVNAGVGIRYWSERFKKTFGVNAYYDYRRTWKNYSQLGLGFELLGDCCDLLDMRLNFYLPVGNKTQHCCSTLFTYPGGYFALATKRQKTLKGLDFELETWLSRLGCCCCIDPYLAVGVYYYRGTCSNNIVGARTRFGFQCWNCLNLEFRISYDPTFKTNAQGLIGLVYDFGPRGSCDCSCCFWPVWRQEIIVLDKKRCTFKTNF